MKVVTKMNKILDNPEWSTSLKISKLETLALRCFPSSPVQKMVIEKYAELKEATK
jgi:hypothetical protein